MDDVELLLPLDRLPPPSHSPGFVWRGWRVLNYGWLSWEPHDLTPSTSELKFLKFFQSKNGACAQVKIRLMRAV